MPSFGWKKKAEALLNLHPYYPQTILLPGWQPLVLPYEHILAIFFGSAAVLAALSLLLSGRVKHFRNSDRILVAWWIITGFIHTIVEGNVVLNAKFYKDVSGNPLNEIWKEYSKADSRYATRDSFTICMEAFTAFVEGPLCFLIVYGMVRKAPWRYTLQILVAFGQLYGDVLYFATTWFEGLIHSRPEALYFWFYFVAVNSIWVVIPSLVIVRSAKAISKSIAISDKTDEIADDILDKKQA